MSTISSFRSPFTASSRAARPTGQAVRLAVSPKAVESAAPAGLVGSFVAPDAAAVRADVITSFCHYVYFFVSESVATPWRDRRPAALLLSLNDAFEVGRLLNQRRYPSLSLS